MSNTIGYVLMLDASGSMADDIPQVVIDAKAFIRQSLPGDQLAVVRFNSDATTLYPDQKGDPIVTVSPSLKETATAATVVQNEVTEGTGLTNLGEAIELGNALIAHATTDLQEFVILSDGEWTTGPDPATVLGSTPPIQVAGLGMFLDRKMFEPLLSLNPASRFLCQPNAYEMIKMFNDIRAVGPGMALAANETSGYSGNDYTLVPSVLAGDASEAQFTVVWSDSGCQYTSGKPGGNLINVTLIDPTGKSLSRTPTVADAGFCIFNVPDARAGTWHTLVQYSVPAPVWGTCGGFEIGTSVTLQVDAPPVHAAGQPLRVTARVLDEGRPVEGLLPQAHVTRPGISIANALERYAAELRSVRPDPRMLETGASEAIARLAALRAARAGQGDILATHKSVAIMQPTGDGGYALELTDTAEAGPYSVRVRVNGGNPATGKRFSRERAFGTLVG